MTSTTDGEPESWAMIARLVDSIRRYGKPRAVRTDTEAVSTSK